MNDIIKEIVECRFNELFDASQNNLEFFLTRSNSSKVTHQPRDSSKKDVIRTSQLMDDVIETSHQHKDEQQSRNEVAESGQRVEGERHRKYDVTQPRPYDERGEYRNSFSRKIEETNRIEVNVQCEVRSLVANLTVDSLNDFVRQILTENLTECKKLMLDLSDSFGQRRESEVAELRRNFDRQSADVHQRHRAEISDLQREINSLRSKNRIDGNERPDDIQITVNKIYENLCRECQQMCRELQEKLRPNLRQSCFDSKIEKDIQIFDKECETSELNKMEATSSRTSLGTDQINEIEAPAYTPPCTFISPHDDTSPVSYLEPIDPPMTSPFPTFTSSDNQLASPRIELATRSLLFRMRKKLKELEARSQQAASSSIHKINRIGAAAQYQNAENTKAEENSETSSVNLNPGVDNKEGDDKREGLPAVESCTSRKTVNRLESERRVVKNYSTRIMDEPNISDDVQESRQVEDEIVRRVELLSRHLSEEYSRKDDSLKEQLNYFKVQCDRYRQEIIDLQKLSEDNSNSNRIFEKVGQLFCEIDDEHFSDLANELVFFDARELYPFVKKFVTKLNEYIKDNKRHIFMLRSNHEGRLVRVQKELLKLRRESERREEECDQELTTLRKSLTNLDAETQRKMFAMREHYENELRQCKSNEESLRLEHKNQLDERELSFKRAFEDYDRNLKVEFDEYVANLVDDMRTKIRAEVFAEMAIENRETFRSHAFKVDSLERKLQSLVFQKIFLTKTIHKFQATELLTLKILRFISQGKKSSNIPERIGEEIQTIFDVVDTKFKTKSDVADPKFQKNSTLALTNSNHAAEFKKDKRNRKYRRIITLKLISNCVIFIFRTKNLVINSTIKLDQT